MRRKDDGALRGTGCLSEGNGDLRGRHGRRRGLARKSPHDGRGYRIDPWPPCPGTFAGAGMETGPVAVWLSHGLRDAGVPLDCIHARRTAAALKLQANKTDRNDVRGLAQLVRSGWYDAVPMKSIAIHRVRAVIVARGQLVRMCTALINKICGLAKTFSVIIGAGKGGAFDRAVRKALPHDPMVRGLLEGLLETLAILRERRRRFDHQLCRVARENKVCRLLMTAPGVGPLTRGCLRCCDRGSVPLSPRARFRRLSGPHADTISIWRGRHRRPDLEIWRSAHAPPALRSRQHHPLPHWQRARIASLGRNGTIGQLEGEGRAGESWRRFCSGWRGTAKPSRSAPCSITMAVKRR